MNIALLDANQITTRRLLILDKQYLFSEQLKKYPEVTNILNNIHCSYSLVCLPGFVPYLLVSFNPLILFCLHLKARAITRKPQGSFIPLA